MKAITTHGNISRQIFSKIRIWHIITALFLLEYSPVHCQKKEETLIGTFDGKQITGLENLSVNRLSNYFIHLDGANSAQYKVIFQFDDFEWDSEPPLVLEQLLPKIEDISVRALKENSIVAEINKVLTMINKFPENIKEKSMSEINTISANCIKDIGYEGKYEDLLITFQTNIAYLAGLYENLKEFNSHSPNGEVQYVEKLASMKGVYDQLKAKNYVRLLKIIIACTKPELKNFAESDIHFPDKEVTNLKILILNKFDLTDTVCTYSTDIYRTGVFKLDFSTGIGVNSLIKPTYYLGNNGSSYISKQNGRDADLSVMALLHANWRVKRNFCIGPVAGVSVSTFDANTGFVLGLGTSFGTKNTISLSAGGIMGKSYKLSSRVSSDGNAADIPLESTISEIPKVDAVNYGWFVSLTYNLTRTKKKA